MNVPSSLLFDFARGTRVATPDGSEASLFIPSILHPTIEFSRVMNTRIPAVSAIQRTSFNIESNFQQPASSGALGPVTLCTFAAGLWIISVTVAFMASFNSVLGVAGPVNTVNLQNPSGQRSALLSMYHGANNPVHRETTFRALFDLDSWLLSAFLGATAVGQTMDMSVHVIGTLLH